MNSYSPFLIAPFNTGLELDLERWLSAQDAFKVLQNAHIKHGVIEKREGYQNWAKMVETDVNLQITNITQANPGVVSVTSAASLINGQRVQINYVSGMTEVNGVEYIVANVAPTSFELQDTAGNNVDTNVFTPYTGNGVVSTFPQERIMGIYQWVDAGNSKKVLVFNKTRASIYNAVNDSLEPLDTTDIFVSGDSDFVTAVDWASSSGSSNPVLNRLYFTNGLSNAGGATNGIRYYEFNTGNPPVTTQYNPQINSATEIRGAKFLFAINQRLVLLHTFEGGNTFPQRARWCQVQNPDNATAWDDNIAGRGGFVDAPSGEQIISAQSLKDFIVVYFTNSVWLLTPTSDPSLPFRWVKLNNWRGVDGKMASVGYDQFVLSLGIRGIAATDGSDTNRIDERIEDFVKNAINNDKFNRVFSKRSYGKERLWNLYPSSLAENSDAALIFDESSKSFSNYLIDLNVLGDGAVAKDYAWDDFPASADSVNPYDLPLTFDDPDLGDLTWQDYHWNAGTELLLGGGYNGEVFKMEFGSTDDGANIPVQLSSAAWNPWIKDGKQAQFGYLDIFVDTSEYMLLDVEYYKDNNEYPYITKTIDLLPDIKQIGLVVNVDIKDDPTDGVRVQSPRNGLNTGDTIYIYGILGMTDLNGGPYTVTYINDDTFDIAIDATGFSNYSSNGIITELEFVQKKIWKRIYIGEIGYQHYINIKSQEMNYPLRIHAFMPWFRAVGSRPV